MYSIFCTKNIIYLRVYLLTSKIKHKVKKMEKNVTDIIIGRVLCMKQWSVVASKNKKKV